jgi:hypothetical protein
MNNHKVNGFVNERAVIRVLQDFTDDELREFARADGNIDDIIQLINSENERVWSRFYLKVCEKYDAFIEAEEKRSFNPDAEYLEKHPESIKLFMSND